ncbi:MAG: protein-glutamate methylesterase/protein-glutamine glutaminase [Desulfovibrio sp.]
MAPIRVLIVDDSALVRQVLTRGLSSDPDIQVVGSAPDPYVARDKIIQLRPDVMTLDVEMPRMDGVEFLRKLMPQFPIPVVMVSSLTERGKRVTLDALNYGAIDFVTKPGGGVGDLTSLIHELQLKIKAASRANVSHWKGRKVVEGGSRIPRLQKPSAFDLIAIGASTGGTEAIRKVISPLPANTPGVVIVQHMPAGFTKMFADRMDTLCAMKVVEAVDGDTIETGKIIIAQGGKHLRVKKVGSQMRIESKPGPLACGHCPSVEVLFDSVAQTVGSKSLAVMLTGMGRDGASAMARLRQTGARTMAQDQESCVVFGMPKEAYQMGGAERLVPLDRISHEIAKLLSTGGK